MCYTTTGLINEIGFLADRSRKQIIGTFTINPLWSLLRERNKEGHFSEWFFYIITYREHADCDAPNKR